MQVQYKGKSLWACTNGLIKIHTAGSPGECKLLDHGKPVQDGLALPQNMEEPPWEAAALLGTLFITKAVVYIALYRKTTIP